MTGFQLKRPGVIMEPDNPLEVERVLIPAAVRGPDGAFHLFPRLVAKGNYSRIGIARVRFEDSGEPCGVERFDIALVVSEDLFRWKRLGIATFAPNGDIGFNGVDHKDASLFPIGIPNPSGKPEMAILHRHRQAG